MEKNNALYCITKTAKRDHKRKQSSSSHKIFTKNHSLLSFCCEIVKFEGLNMIMFFYLFYRLFGVNLFGHLA